MAKIFISGVAGFLGSHLADRFLQAGHEVRGVDNLIGGYLDNVSESVKFRRCDLADIESYEDLLDDIDIVYHAACTAYEGLSVFSPALIVQNTVQITVNLIVASIRSGVKRFIYCSSMARYGTQPIIPYTEDMICAPQDPYGIAKLSAELLLKNMGDVHGMDYVIAVPHNIIGPRQKYDDPFRNVASIMINMMLQGRQPVIYGDGSQVRCFSDVYDDVDCLAELAFSKDAVGEVFNVGPDEEPVSINELYALISRKLSFDRPPLYVSDRPQEVKFATCSAEKIRKYFNYQTRYSLGESIDRLIEYISQRGPAPFDYHLPIEIKSPLLPATWRDHIF